MEEYELKHPHVSPDLNEQRSIIHDEALTDYFRRRSDMHRALDVLVDIKSLSDKIVSLCDDYLQLDRNFSHESGFSYLGVIFIADSISYLVSDNIRNLRSAISEFDSENLMCHGNKCEE